MNETAPATRLYHDAILYEAPRVLGLMDRQPLSPTEGCCDRTFWAWKFVDFCAPRFQEAVCVLSFLYARHYEGSVYHRNPKLLGWIGSGLRFWTRLQHGDGSFDEAYPFEHSVAATAFTPFYVAEALELLGTDLPEDVSSVARAAIVRAGRWLLRNDETHGFLSNHLAAAAAALDHAFRLSGEAVFQARSRELLERILSHQSPEGWYEEYGGADPGYQTHGCFYLARLWERTGHEDLGQSLDRSMTFLAELVHPDGSLGGEYASRATQTYYPAAFEILAGRSPAAAWIAERMRPALRDGAVASLRSVDAYNYFPFLNNYVFASLARARRIPGEAPPPSGPKRFLWFPEAGIVRIRTSAYEAYVGTASGGVLKVFDLARRELVYSDCGYVGRLHDGGIASSQYYDPKRQVAVTESRIVVEGSFCEVSRPTMDPARFVAFRLFMLTVGRIGRVARAVKELLVRRLIYRRRALDVSFRRTIDLSETTVGVCDEIGGADGARFEALLRADELTTVHMGSARYFIRGELVSSSAEEAGTAREIPPSAIVAGTSLRRSIRFPVPASD